MTPVPVSTLFSISYTFPILVINPAVGQSGPGMNQENKVILALDKQGDPYETEQGDPYSGQTLLTFGKETGVGIVKSGNGR